mmetsp:Transcript_9808/g.13609  ORF Transcript_9808/g.13609 Transcript_9808/m.13609 type:complete len:512 (+) Transcript_9808:37-1572(+)
MDSEEDYVDVVYENILSQVEKSTTSQHFSPSQNSEEDGWLYLARSSDLLGSRRRKSSSREQGKSTSKRSKKKKSVYTSIMVHQIELADSSWLAVQLRMTIIWRPWNDEIWGQFLEEDIAATKEKRDCYKLTRDQIESIDKPIIRINAPSIEKSADEMRLYPRAGILLWTTFLKVSMPQHFDLATFPLDTQILILDFILESEDNLCLHQISFAESALDLGAEWSLVAPRKLRRGPRSTAISLAVSRNYRYYILNAFVPLCLIFTLLPLVYLVKNANAITRLHLATSLFIAIISFKYTLIVLRCRIPPNCAQSNFLDTFFIRIYLFLFFGTIGLVATAKNSILTNIESPIFFLTLSLYFFLFGSWLYTIRHTFLTSPAYHSPLHSSAWRKKPDQAWYTFRFEFPAFLPPPQQQHRLSAHTRVYSDDDIFLSSTTPTSSSSIALRSQTGPTTTTTTTKQHSATTFVGALWRHPRHRLFTALSLLNPIPSSSSKSTVTRTASSNYCDSSPRSFSC